MRILFDCCCRIGDTSVSRSVNKHPMRDDDDGPGVPIDEDAEDAEAGESGGDATVETDESLMDETGISIGTVEAA